MTITAEFNGTQFDVSSADGVLLEDVQEAQGRVKRKAFTLLVSVTPIVAGVPGTIIRVLAFTAQPNTGSGSGGAIRLKSNTTPLTGVMSLPLVTDTVLLPFLPGYHWVETLPGEALTYDGVFNALNGFIIYTQD